MSRFLLFFVIFVGLGLTIWQIASRSSGAYERMLVQRVENGLEVLGYDWARIRADGLKLELHGHAPDTFARELALESARATATVATVTSYATATLAPPERRDPIRIEFLRDATGVTMTGQTANRDMRTLLNSRLTGGGAGLTVRDLTGIQAAPPPRNWGPEIDVAIMAATKLANAYVVMEPGQVLIDGQAIDAKDRSQLIAALRQAAGEVVLLNLRIRIPEKVIAPFAFSAEKLPGGEIQVETCAVRDEAEDQAVRAALDPNGRKPAFSICQVGLGGPDGDWPGAITSAIVALNALPAGRVDLEYRHIRLTAAPPTLAEDFDPVIERLEKATPEGYTLATVLQGDDIATRTEIARDLYWMKLNRTAEGVELQGQVPDAKAATAIRAYALAIFGAGSVTGELVVIDTPAPRHWQIAALAMVDQLALSAGGSAQMAGHTITVSGTLNDPRLVRLIQRELESGLPNYDIMTRFTIDLPAQLAAIPMPGPRCAARLSAVHRARLIEFSTGSARITKESGPVLDALARVFERCNDDRIEVGGHTDSQGAEDLNQRISQARAEAVVAALVERGVAPDRIVAKGYGETVPVASNETEDGRARNRRIEFKQAPRLAIAPESGTDANTDTETGTNAETTDTPAPDADKARE